MRTSYDREKVEKSVEKEEVKDNSQDIVIKGKLVEAYKSIEEELSYRREEELRGYGDALSDSANEFESRERELRNRNSEDFIEESESQEKSTSSGKKKKIIIACSVIGAVLVVGLGGFFAYKNLSKGSRLESVETRVSKLYTSKDKNDIKSDVSQSDLNDYYLELIDLQKDGVNVDSIMSELDSIGYYLEDMGKLETFNSESYDLTTVGLSDELVSIVDNAETYSVSGLAVSVNNMASKVMEDYNSFIGLRQELNGISDVINFDEESYKSKIDMISHVPNRVELTAVYDKLVVDKQAAEAQKKLDEAADEQAKAEAEQALKDAQELQKKTQEELESTKKKLEEEAKKAAEALKENEEIKKESEEKVEQENPVDGAETITPEPTEGEEPGIPLPGLEG